jgi:hypothetical protein
MFSKWTIAEYDKPELPREMLQIYGWTKSTINICTFHKVKGSRNNVKVKNRPCHYKLPNKRTVKKTRLFQIILTVSKGPTSMQTRVSTCQWNLPLDNSFPTVGGQEKKQFKNQNCSLPTHFIVGIFPTKNLPLPVSVEKRPEVKVALINLSHKNTMPQCSTS